MAVTRSNYSSADDLFATPTQVEGSGGGGESLHIADVEGSLVVIRAEADEVVIDTKLGEASALPAQILVVDGKSAGPDWQRILLFGVVLRRQAGAAQKSGRPLVGVVGRGEPFKVGQSAPWIIADPTAAQVEAARKAYLAVSVPF